MKDVSLNKLYSVLVTDFAFRECKPCYIQPLTPHAKELLKQTPI